MPNLQLVNYPMNVVKIGNKIFDNSLIVELAPLLMGDTFYVLVVSIIVGTPDTTSPFVGFNCSYPILDPNGFAFSHLFKKSIGSFGL